MKISIPAVYNRIARLHLKRTVPYLISFNIVFLKQIVLLNCDEISGIHIGALHAVPCSKAGHR